MRRGAFSLVELLVAVSIVLVLMAMLGGALMAARNSGKKQATQAVIKKLDDIVSAQFRKYDSRRVSLPDSLPPGMTPSSYRAWYIRRNMITGDMVDRWTDVAYMADRPAEFASAAQRSYAATYRAAVAAGKVPTAQFAGAECLFMIVMQGGFADCLDCNSLAQLKKGDKDGDGMFEFWDEWGNPIGYLLWPPAYEMSGKNERFFVGDRALDAAFPPTGSVRPSLGMRPLIYSAGTDREYGIERNDEAPRLSRGSAPVGRDCANPLDDTVASSGGPASDAGSKRADNITNLDAEAGQ